MRALLWVTESEPPYRHLFDFIYLNFILSRRFIGLRWNEPVKVAVTDRVREGPGAAGVIVNE